MKLIFLLFLGVVALNATPIPLTPLESQILIQADIDNKQSVPDYRLNDDVVPIRYDVQIKPYFLVEGSNAAFTFEGHVKILVKPTRQNVATIVLHADRLTITNDWIVYAENDRENPVPHSIAESNPETHKLTLNLNSPLQENVNYVIEMNYVGEMSNDMHGFYRTSYTENGVTKWLGSTQFQATSARRALPCFDEPKFKAVFQLTMDRPTAYTPSLSNTRIQSSVILPDATRTREVFQPTPIMSSYLLAFIVSEYEGRPNPTGNQATFARPAAFDQTSYSMTFADAVLKEFDAFTDYAYLSVPAIEKLDQAAIPDFSAGAMENWGLMTYRESMILVDPVHSTTINKQRIAAVISHEIAHQWFGDLVTCDWWDYTWLNEGFATFFQYFGTHWVENDWELDLQFVVEQYHSSFLTDSLETTHAMTNEVNSPAEVEANFDTINYNKAGSVLRMLEHIMGSANFKLALQDYLKQNAFSTTTPGNLWAAIQNRVPALQVGRIMDPWTSQAGYPYITVTVTGDNVTVTQKRFLLKNKDHEDNTMWPIAMTYSTKESDFANTLPQQIYYIEDGAEKAFRLPERPENYFIVNNQQTGFYRVNYDVDSWMKIKAALNSPNYGGIHVLNRAQIVDDLFNFARAGVVEYGTALDILSYIKTEKSYVPWLAAFNGLTYITRRIVGEAALEEFEYFINDVLSEVYKEVGYFPKADDAHTQILLRNNVLNWLCRYGHEDCLQNSREEFAKYVAQPISYQVNPDHRQVVYCTGLRNGSAAEFNLLWTRYLTTNVAHEQLTIINSMGCTKSPELLTAFLDAILSNDIRYQDKAAAFNSALTGNPENVEVVYEYLKVNYLNWAENFGFNGLGAVASAFSSVADRFTTPEQVARLRQFVTDNQAVLGDGPAQVIRSALTEAEWQMDWAERNGPSVLDFLVDRRNSAATTTYSVFITVFVAMFAYVLQ